MEVGDIANGRTRPAYEGIECWVALNGEQVDAMLADGAQPDVYSKRFGLRQTPEEALGRAAEFMAWRPRGQPEELCPLPCLHASFGLHDIDRTGKVEDQEGE